MYETSEGKFGSEQPVASPEALFSTAHELMQNHEKEASDQPGLLFYGHTVLEGKSPLAAEKYIGINDQSTNTHLQIAEASLGDGRFNYTKITAVEFTNKTTDSLNEPTDYFATNKYTVEFTKTDEGTTVDIKCSNGSNLVTGQKGEVIELTKEQEKEVLEKVLKRLQSGAKEGIDRDFTEKVAGFGEEENRLLWAGINLTQAKKLGDKKALRAAQQEYNAAMGKWLKSSGMQKKEKREKWLSLAGLFAAIFAPIEYGDLGTIEKKQARFVEAPKRGGDNHFYGERFRLFKKLASVSDDPEERAFLTSRKAFTAMMGMKAMHRMSAPEGRVYQKALAGAGAVGKFAVVESESGFTFMDKQAAKEPINLETLGIPVPETDAGLASNRKNKPE